MTIEILLIMILAVLSLTAGVLIAALLEMRHTAISVRKFMEKVDENLKPTLDELNETLRKTKKAADNIDAVSEDIRAITSSTKRVAEDVEAVTSMIREIPPRFSSLWAGIQTALSIISKGTKH